MFNISLKQEPYLTYILTDETTNSRVEIVPERGGIITSWNIQGQEIFYLDKERFLSPDLSVRGGNPVLFPICGNLIDDTFIYEDKSYQLKQHGFARDSAWQVVDQSVDDCATLTVKLTSNDQTKLVYPFDFELFFTYKFEGNKLTILISCHNNSDKIMPFSLGFHPYFWCANKKELQINIPSNQYEEKATNKVINFDGKLDFNQEEIDIVFKSLKSNNTGFIDSTRNLKLNINYSDFFSSLVFWTVKGKDFICLEPWSAPRNAINTGEQLDYIKPNETKEAFLEMTISNG